MQIGVQIGRMISGKRVIMGPADPTMTQLSLKMRRTAAVLIASMINSLFLRFCCSNLQVYATNGVQSASNSSSLGDNLVDNAMDYEL